ncbi:putative beta-glucosidase [Tirmania nivea]|nr:putative beta-glucosidase [Tirmania nivea]
MSNWMNQETGEFNASALEDNMVYKRRAFYVGQPVDWETLAWNIERGQKWLLENTTLGIPALIQTEGIHGFLIGNATTFNSPTELGCSCDPSIIPTSIPMQIQEVIAQKAAALVVNNLFVRVVDLARELRFGRVEEMYSECAAMVKHFAAFGSPEQGLNTVPVIGGERELRRTYLPAFKRSIIDGDAWSVMGSYNSYDGVPTAADHYLLTASASDKLCNDLAICEKGDMRAVTMLALGAGNDMEMGGGSFNYRKAVSRILTTKFKAGLFEHPLVTASRKSKDLAREIDRQSNTLFDGIKFALANIDVKINYAQGGERWSTDQSGIPAAVEAVEASGVAVVVVGTWSRDQGELWRGLNATTGEHVDVHNLNLVGAQADLVRAVINTGRPTIVGGNALADVLFGKYNPFGKLSVSFPGDIGTAPSYYDHMKGGRPVDARRMFPNGTLIFGHQYVLNDPRPLYPFGYRKSYSQFEYSDLKLSKTNATASDIVKATIKVKNTSTIDRAEVVQLYVNNKVTSVVTLVKELKGFKKVNIGAGKTVTVGIPINVADLGGEFEVQIGESSESIKAKASFWV